MTITNPFQRIPERFRTTAYALTALLAVLLLWLWIGAERDRFGDLPDFAAMEEDVTMMKAAFYAYLTPMVIHHNDSIRDQRARLKEVQQKISSETPLSGADRRWLNTLAEQYELESDQEMMPQTLVQTLLLRVDTVPLELPLVQAAKESGWGRSRFAVEANNLFGQWCYVEGCGMVPSNRAAGANHEIEVFSSVSEAMRRYMNNLNTHDSYSDFRRLRQQLRESGKPLTGMALVNGLILYSERREAYVEDIRGMLQQYRRIQAQASTQAETAETAS